MSKSKKLKKKHQHAVQDDRLMELQVELLRERIYSTLALLAVLLTIDPHHMSAGKAAILVGGTALSLWAAAIIASRMSYRVVMQKNMTDVQSGRQYLRHAPLLGAAILPLACIGLAYLHVISLSLAINASIGLLFFLMAGWSLLSARPMRTGILTTLVIAAVELGIGAAVIMLKKAVGH